MIYSNNTYDITNDISTYTRTDFNSVYDTTRGKWYMLNNLDTYEEYGIYGTSLDDTKYVGKLVEVNDHEYEWDGTEWDDLGPYVEVKYPYILFPNSISYSSSPRFETDVYLKNTYTIEFKIKTPDSNGSYNRMLLGTFETYGQINKNHFAIWTQSGNTGGYTVGWWNYGSNSTMFTEPAFVLQPNTEYIIKIQVGTGETYINNVLQAISGGNNVNGTLLAPLIIGELQYNNPGYNGQIYYVKVSEGDELIAYYEANNDNNILGYKDTVSDNKITNVGGGTATYGEDSETTRPKDYPAKATPTITSLWASTIYRNSAHLTKLMRNDAEMAKIDYMSDDILKKGEAPHIDYLCFEAIEAGNVIFEAPNGFSQLLGEPNLEYSFDKSSWTTLHINETVNLSANDKIYFRGDNSNGWCYAKGPNWTVSTLYINCLHYTGRYNISGNIMTLIDKSGKTTTIPNTGCFCNIFCTELTSSGANKGKIVSAANLSLPATTLTYNCYRNMFNGNKLMTYPPVILPAMTMAKQCYANMFLRCSALLESPILPATALSNECYKDMFNSCSSLRKITCYATSGIGSGTSKGTDNWCYGISNGNGDFYKASSASWPTGTSGIPSGWTVHTSL